MNGGTNPKFTITLNDMRAYAVMKPSVSTGTTVSALPSRNTLILDGVSTDLPAVNIDGFNWLKLRDLAALLSATNKRFEVGYDAAANAVTVTSDKPYVSVGDELTNFFDSAAEAVSSPQKLFIDAGKTVDLGLYEEKVLKNGSIQILKE
jgi:hypothetical protein